MHEGQHAEHQGGDGPIEALPLPDTDAHSETGWFRDPFAQHEARWISEGRATDLVRDHGIEGHESAPDHAAVPELQELTPASTSGPDDLLRADENTRVDQSVHPGDSARAAEGAGEMGLDAR